MDPPDDPSLEIVRVAAVGSDQEVNSSKDASLEPDTDEDLIRLQHEDSYPTPNNHLS